jgi:thioredoxin 1
VSENAVNINESNFQKTVLESQKPVLVDFWATWCGPCRMVEPIVDELSKEYQDKVDFGKINVDEAPMLASQYGVMSIPTLIVFKNGKPEQQVIGFKPKNELKAMLDKALQ